MATYGLLIDYEYCTNCGSCQVTCKEEHGFPLPTDLCDLCKDRTARGREPICVHHCLANILYYGTVEELSKKLEEKPKQMLIVPQFMPREAKGEFVHQENATDAHKAAAMEVTGTGASTFGAHREDAV